MTACVWDLRVIGHGGSYWLMLANHILLLGVGFGVGFTFAFWRLGLIPAEPSAIGEHLAEARAVEQHQEKKHGA